jgi:mannosyltransferase OCH1-like enzyme
MAMQISQIFLSDDEVTLSPFLEHSTETVKQSFPGANYQLFTKENLRRFIEENYGEKVLAAYDSLKPYAYKADLGRYCLLNKLGGWYVDIGVRLANAVDVGPRIELLAFRDIQRFSGTSWAASIGILYSQPNNSALEFAIDAIVDNCQEKYYGITPLCPTGPTLFGAALAAYGSNANFVYGDYLELTPVHSNKNRAFVLPDGTIVGWGKPTNGGDLTGLGAKGTNNYNELWASRQVYQ